MADGWLSTLLGYHRLKDALGNLFPQRSTLKFIGATVTDDEEEKQTIVEVAPGGVSDHGALAGLGDDDHAQYLLANGSRALTGNQSAGGHKITGLAAASANGDAVRYEQLPSIGSPVALTVGGANVNGVLATVPRADHKHALPAFGTAAGTFCEGNDARLGGGFAAALYSGFHDDDINWSSTTWADVHGPLDTITDVDQVGITRSGSDWTIDDAGDYVFHARVCNFKSGVVAAIALRLLLNGTQVAQVATSRNNAAQLGDLILHRYVRNVAASDVLTLEYQVTLAFGIFGQIALSDQDGRAADIEIYRVR